MMEPGLIMGRLQMLSIQIRVFQRVGTKPDRSSVKEYEVVFANEAMTQNRLVMCIWSS
jgi:hypothetical protein